MNKNKKQGGSVIMYKCNNGRFVVTAPSAQN